VIDALVRGDHAQVVNEMDQFMAVRPEARFGHYQMMVHALGGDACTAPGRMYSEYENSIGTGQVHVWFDQPADGWTGAS
jgi:3,4-dihydroxyphenylacetate 2,3-dioxygenase